MLKAIKDKFCDLTGFGSGERNNNSDNNQSVGRFQSHTVVVYTSNYSEEDLAVPVRSFRRLEKIAKDVDLYNTLLTRCVNENSRVNLQKARGACLKKNNFHPDSSDYKGWESEMTSCLSLHYTYEKQAALLAPSIRLENLNGEQIRKLAEERENIRTKLVAKYNSES